MTSYHRLTTLPAPRQAVFAFHQQPGAFDKLTPPWTDIDVLRHDGIADGALVKLRLVPPFLPVKITWELEHTGFIQDQQFVDRQVHGPFRSWTHTHCFLDTAEGCTIDDCIEFELPLPVPFLANLIKRDLDRLFDYRETVLRKEFADES